MNIIDNVTSIMRKGPELAAQINAGKLNTKSIIKGANDATFQFPCLIVESIPIDFSTTIAQSLDPVYAAFTQTWVSLHPFIDISLDPTPMSYLAKMHQNLKLEGVELAKSYIDNGEALVEAQSLAYDGKAELYMNKEQTFGILFEAADRITVDALKSHREYMREHLSEFDLYPIMTEAESDGTTSMDLANALIDSRINKIRNSENDASLKATGIQNRAPRLLDRDVKRANDMTPYAIQVRLIAKNEKNEFVQYIDFVIGVKTILHPIASDDLIENIQRAVQNKSVLFKFLRWTTGEISLFKNIILNLDDIKTDAVNRQNGKNPFIGILKRLKARRIGIRNFTQPHALIPNATIVLSTYEADYLRDKCGIDVRDAAVARRIMDALFLVAFDIADESTGTISVLYDGSDSFQTYSLESLERENSLRSNKLSKEIGRMIAH